MGGRRRRDRHLPVRQHVRPGGCGERPGDVRDHPRAPGPRAAGANLTASFLINLLTLTAEVGGIALALQLASSVEPRLWIPVAALALWLVVWRTKFSTMENVTGLVGLTLVVFAVAVFLLGPDWTELADQALSPTVPAPRVRPRTGTTRSRCSARR